jgi:zinc protease
MLARDQFLKLVYGNDHILSTDRMGTETSVPRITMDDLKTYYERVFSPTIGSFLVSGSIAKDQVVSSLTPFATSWQAKDVDFPAYKLPEPLQKSTIVFVDVPGAKQSVINIGNLALARHDHDFHPATVMNYKLGGSFNGNVNLVLREEKGYTYGARTGFSGGIVSGTFVASASVRSSATEESVAIFKDLMTRYPAEFKTEDLEFTRNSLLKGYALQFETLGAKISMLNDIALYQLPVDYIKSEKDIIQNMTVDRVKALAAKYVDPTKMFYVIAGDAKTQLEPLEKIGFGKAELIEKK